MEEMLSIAQVAERLQVSVATVRRLIERGELPAVRVGRLWRISSNALEAYLGGDDPLALLATLSQSEGDGGNEQAIAVFQRMQAEIPGLLERVRTLAETADEDTRHDCRQVLDVAACLERVGARGELDDKIMAFLGALTVYAGARRLLRVTH
jgi:excisionase family DNA binding protein